MSSRFVSAGTTDDPATTTRSKEWLAAQSALEARATAEKLAAQQRASQGGGGEKSLYETLQANKAAKEEAFQEANKFKNQFRALDDDEADFLADIVQRERDAERAARRETDAQIEDFKARQASTATNTLLEGDGAAIGKETKKDGGGAEEWSAAAGRKRRREQGRIVGVKVRRTSTGQSDKVEKQGEERREDKEESDKTTTNATDSKKHSPPAEAKTTPPAPPKLALGLADYSSDDD